MFKKLTIVSGSNAAGEFEFINLNGHWNLKSAIRRGRRQIVGEMKIEHTVLDMSGGGRGGHDGKWTVAADDSINKQSSWAEFGAEHN